MSKHLADTDDLRWATARLIVVSRNEFSKPSVYRTMLIVWAVIVSLAFIFEAAPTASQGMSEERTPSVQTLTVSSTASIPVIERDSYTVTMSYDAALEVRTIGHQAQIDSCTGPVLSVYEGYGSVIGEHNHCGGAYVLDLKVGDLVRIDGYREGTYVVTGSLDVHKTADAGVLGWASLYLQTCYFNSDMMRLVGLAPA